MTTVAEIRAARTPGTFPTDLLTPGVSVLDLYCAGYLGRNVASWCADACVLTYVGIDEDRAKLDEMRALWDLDGWDFVHADARDLAPLNIRGTFDIVVADPWTQEIPALWERRDELAKLVAPRGHLVLGAMTEQLERYAPARTVARSRYMGGVWWAVIPC